MRTSLFKTKSTCVKTALTDWRPLPRANQKSWHDEYTLLGDNDVCYMQAFDFKEKDLDSDLLKFVEDRTMLLQRLIKSSAARYLIMIGEVDTKIEALRRFFPDMEIQLTRIPMRY